MHNDHNPPPPQVLEYNNFVETRRNGPTTYNLGFFVFYDARYPVLHCWYSKDSIGEPREPI